MNPSKMTIPKLAPATLADLPAALDLAAFEQVEGGLFQPLGRLPEWIARPLGIALDEPAINLGDLFPMLEMFLPECETAWQGESDIWTETDANGRDNYLQAVATELNGRRFLVLKTLPEALYTYQQLAHDFELEKEKVERLSREVELKRQEAERATQAKSEFLARMSHEIRTPLNAVIGMADVLSATLLTPEQRRCVEVSQRNGIGLLNLINDILDMAKVESGKVDLEVTAFDLRDVLARAMEVIEARATAKGLTLRSTLAADLPVLLVGDPNRLRQVLINLLGNSIKFTEKGGLEIQVGGNPEDSAPGRLRFGVTDTGIGIAPDKVNAVFESFAQADTSTTRKYGGTGLGLAISKQLVELMGGRIWVESTPGVGSTFFFTAVFGVQVNAPSAPKPATATDAQVDLKALELQLAGMKILLADDSADNRFLVLSYLKRTGSLIDIAENGAIAVEMFRVKRYDVVLMDVEMPVMDGYTATRAIRALESETGAAATPVLALTAHAFAEMAIRSIGAGFTELLTKPIRSVTLLQALAKYPILATESASAEPPVVKVVVEEGMEDIVPGYVERRRAEIPLYQRALGTGDMEAIRMMAHRMKGTGTGYGLPALTEFGGAMEQAAAKNDAGELGRKLEEFSRYLNSVELEYK